MCLRDLSPWLLFLQLGLPTFVWRVGQEWGCRCPDNTGHGSCTDLSEILGLPTICRTVGVGDLNCCKIDQDEFMKGII